MPLPIETPAPKASSLIKRFQQTIDRETTTPPQQNNNLNNNQTRRSASAGNPPSTNHETIPNSRPQSFILTQSASKIHSNLNPNSPNINRNSVQLPIAPPIDRPSDLSRLADLSKSDLAVQSPVPLPKPTKHESTTTTTITQQTKVKATISPDVPLRSRKTTNNITAPTAASLAKIRDSQLSRSNSLASNSNTHKPNPVKQPSAGKTTPPTTKSTHDLSTGTAIIRRTRTGSNPPQNDKPKIQHVRPSTPATNHTIRKAAMANIKPPPMPSSTTTMSTRAPSVLQTSSDPLIKSTTARRVVTADSSLKTTTKPVPAAQQPKKLEQRPLQRARVASVATPISGVRKSSNPNKPAAQSPNLKPAVQPAGKPARATPAPTKRSPAPSKRSVDPKTVSSRTQSGALRSAKSSKLGSAAVKSSTPPAVPFPVEPFPALPSVANSPAAQDAKILPAPPPNEPDTSPLDTPPQQVYTPLAAEDQPDHRAPEPQVASSAGLAAQATDEEATPPAVEDPAGEAAEAPATGEVSVVVLPEGPAAADGLNPPAHPSQALLKHRSAVSATSDDDLSRPDFDASTTTNTDVDESELLTPSIA